MAQNQVAAMAGSTSHIARLTGIRHVYPGAVALDDVDLLLPKGRMIGFIGPDGVGKSTLLGLVAGVRVVQTGKVEVFGADIEAPATHTGVVRRIAYMPQGLGRNLYPSLSVEENLDFFARLFGQDRDTRAARIAELLWATGLSEFARRRAAHLSGGMKQKLALCCALIHEPDLLILDEPTTGVDPLARRRFWELIGRLHIKNPDMSLLVATAYMEEAELFDWLVVMDEGRVLATGSVEELKVSTGESDMERVFVALLPDSHRHGHRRIEALPRSRFGDSPPAIAAEDLTRNFGDFVAVDRVSFQIERGEIFGFLGSNGCGKTTTMRMLTGLLPPTAGQVRIFDRPVNAADLSLRRQVGFMSQSFSLYTELSVRQNLQLHARLYRLPTARVEQRVTALAKRFGLGRYMNARPQDLPLGIRQRLSLAVAIIHDPELLILDEPTSGVDPVARDSFWELLMELSREHGVTIFVSTHFMNEATRCDRISLMHGGRVLAVGEPARLIAEKEASSLEQAFIAHLEAVDEIARPDQPVEGLPIPPAGRSRIGRGATGRPFCIGRLLAYARREAKELRRDPIRLAFALLGPLLLMIAMGYGISFDVERIRYAALDWDRTPESRAYLDHFNASNYFHAERPVVNAADLFRRMRSGRLTVVLEIPPGFGRDLTRGRTPELGAWIDGAVPFRAETIRGYVEGTHRHYLNELARQSMIGTTADRSAVELEIRFRYNQTFLSVYAMVPGILMLLLIMIPATMTAVGVVREKELGSIINLYATPTTGLEFLLGKQLPYIGLALLSYLMLLTMALVLFQVPLKGSLLGLTVGALLFVFATTGFGLLMSTFMRSQIAAIFGTAIASVIPTILFSGMLSPVASLTGAARFMGYGFPSSWFNHVSIGSFTKALAPLNLVPDYLVLGAFGLIFLALGRIFLRTRER